VRHNRAARVRDRYCTIGRDCHGRAAEGRRPDLDVPGAGAGIGLGVIDRMVGARNARIERLGRGLLQIEILNEVAAKKW